MVCMNGDGEKYLIVLDYKLVQWWLALRGSPSSFGLLGRAAAAIRKRGDSHGGTRTPSPVSYR